MAKCWAAEIGGCGGGFTHEHLVSDCVFPNGVFVQGFKWCKEPVRVNDLTAQILCGNHNHALSELDAEAGRAFKAFQKFYQLAEEFQKTGKPQNIRILVNGPLLERWFLKTMINLSVVEKALRIGKEGVPGKPSKEIVELVFGLRQFTTKGDGLWLAARQAGTILTEDKVTCTMLNKGEGDEYLRAASFNFRGYNFIMHLEQEIVEERDGDVYMYARYTPRQMVFNWATQEVAHLAATVGGRVFGYVPKVSHSLVINGW